jgi:hypothetical protein
MLPAAEEVVTLRFGLEAPRRSDSPPRSMMRREPPVAIREEQAYVRSGFRQAASRHHAQNVGEGHIDGQFEYRHGPTSEVSIR